MKILLTGGLGYIGSHTAIALLENGHELIIVDNLDNSNKTVLNQLQNLSGKPIQLFVTDIKDFSTLQTIPKIDECDGIIHFAAKKSVPESLENPIIYYEDNITGLVNLLSLAEKLNIPNFIFSSSCTVYGTPNQLPVTEETPTEASATPYGNTKRWGEEIIQEYASLKDKFRSVLLRYFNPVGAHPSSLIGELPNGIPSNLMPFITQTAAGIRDSLAVFGNDYNTPDGTAIRDFIHVMDLAKAHVLALEWLAKNPPLSENSAVFNVGTGNGFSVLEIINSFERTSGQSLNWSFAPRRNGDIEKIWADPTKIKQTLGWQPEYNLDDMTHTAWEWQKALVKMN